MIDRLPGDSIARLRARLDRAHPVVAATAVSVIVGLFAVGLVVGGQTGLAMAVTGGSQPAASVATVPTTADASAWSSASSRTVTLHKQQMALPFGGGSVDEVTVDALHNESHVSFRLTWPDPTRDVALDRPNAYSDAAAIMLRTGEQPPIMMGGAGEPVNIWYWRASWQHGAPAAADEAGMYDYRTGINESNLPGRAAGNALSRASYSDYGQNYYASGFGSLSDARAQNVHATGQRTADGWQVVFTRERSTDGQHDAQIEGSEPVYLAFAVWNGSAGEVNGKKSISLQFSKLTGDDGSLVAADPGSGDGGTDEADGTSSGSGAGLLGGDLGSYIAMLLGAMALSWLYAYRHLRGES